jgi:hypothetical protein
MMKTTSLPADALGRYLADTYRRIFGEEEPQIASALDEAARLVIERIANSDALYHNTQHTALVTLCVQDTCADGAWSGSYRRSTGHTPS